MATWSTEHAIPRNLHPGAWWLWAIGLMTVASRTHNPLVLLLVLGVVANVVLARRSNAPWARSFEVFLKIGLVVILIRTVAQVLLGTPLPGSVIFTLPALELPDWAAGISIGGAVTKGALAGAVTDGLRLATVLICIGAANALANPKRLLAAMPAALYEVGVATIVAMSFAPSLVVATSRIRAARRLRGRPDRGLKGVISVAIPVLEDALERSLSLASAMDSRGYGRRAEVPRSVRRTTSLLLIGGLLGLAIASYGLLDAATPGWMGLPLLVLAVTASIAGLSLAGRRAVRSRYRPDPWGWPEWLTAGCGLVAAVGVIVAGLTDPQALAPPLLPLSELPLPIWVAVGTLTAAGPAWFTPKPVDMMVAANTPPASSGEHTIASPAADGARDQGTRATEVSA